MSINSKQEQVKISTEVFPNIQTQTEIYIFENKVVRIP